MKISQFIRIRYGKSTVFNVTYFHNITKNIGIGNHFRGVLFWHLGEDRVCFVQSKMEETEDGCVHETTKNDNLNLRTNGNRIEAWNN